MTTKKERKIRYHIENRKSSKRGLPLEVTLNQEKAVRTFHNA